MELQTPPLPLPLKGGELMSLACFAGKFFKIENKIFHYNFFLANRKNNPV